MRRGLNGGGESGLRGDGVCECWEVVIDRGWQGGEPSMETWDGAVGVWRGADTGKLALPEAARVVHVATRIGAAAQACASLRLPAGVTLVDLSGLRLTSLGDSALSDCPNLTSIEAPGGCSLGAVGNRFAYGTPQLRRVDLGLMGMTLVGYDFLRESGLKRVDLSGL